MIQYGLEDFVGKYYGKCWLRYKDGTVVFVNGLADDPKNVRLKSKGNKFLDVPLADINWGHVAIPKLGYRNIISGGKGLYYFRRKVGRIIRKGFCDETIAIDLVPGLLEIMNSLGLDSFKYQSIVGISHEIANAVYNAEFTNISDAVNLLKTKQDAIGYALDYDFAVILGQHQHEAFKIMWKQKPAALSSDGQNWTVLCKEFKNVFSRHQSTGNLRYV